MRPLVIGLFGAAAAITLAVAGPPAIRAAEITVTTTVDEVSVNGECSLREAVIAANTNVAVDACPAGSSADSDGIQLASGRYELSIAGAGEDAAATGDLDLLGRTVIQGDVTSPNATVIDGGGLDRVFDVHGDPTRVTFRWVVISGGAAAGEDGGGIRLATGGAPVGPSCTVSTALYLSTAVVRDNTAARGGGIFIEGCGELETEWVSVADNMATGDGGGIAAGSLTSMVIINSTVTANVAGGAGGGLWAEGSAAGGLFFSTVADNVSAAGGGISIGPSPGQGFTLNSVILAHNAGDGCQLTPGSVRVIYTLSTDGTCGSPGDGNLPSTDPLLHPRDDDPVAYRLQPESPAIDAGDPRLPCTPLLETDQYGALRALDGDGDGVAICDIGSYEAPSSVPDPTASPSPSDGGLPNTAVDASQPASLGPVSVMLTVGTVILILVAWLLRSSTTPSPSHSAYVD